MAGPEYLAEAPLFDRAARTLIPVGLAAAHEANAPSDRDR